MPLVDTLQEKTAALVAPIDGASPVGVDFTFEGDFESVKKEVDKLSSVEDKPNWGAVATGSAAILKSKSKDFRIAIWNTVGLMQVNGFAGFAEGLVVLRGLVTQYWEPMFPDVKRGRARSNMMSWMTDQAANFVEKIDVNERNGEAVKVSDEMLNEVDSVLAEKLGELYTGLGRLKNVMRDKVRQIPAPPPPPPPPGESGSATTSTAEVAVYVPETFGGGGGTDVPVASGLADADTALVFHGQAIATVGHVLRRENAMEPNAYRLLRVGTWLPMLALPYADGITTMIPPPPFETTATWDALAETEAWGEILEAVETEIPNYPFWFDLNRRSAMALDKLGPEYKLARASLGRAVVSFVTALAGITKLAFSDGTPFADTITAEWLAGEQEKYGGSSGPSKSSLAVNAEEEELKKRMEEAKGMVFGGNVPDGLSLASQLAMRAVDARSRFRSRIAVAQLALDSGKRDIARAMLEALIIEADRHDLDQWEPGLSVPLYANLLACLRAGRGPDEAPSPEMMVREALLFDKLCRLDPAAALKLAGVAGGLGG